MNWRLLGRATLSVAKDVVKGLMIAVVLGGLVVLAGRYPWVILVLVSVIAFVLHTGERMEKLQTKEALEKLHKLDQENQNDPD